MNKSENLNGALTGIAIAAATTWARYDDDTQRRLRNVRADAEEALDLVRDMQSRADAVRNRLATVMDAQVGLALASPQPAAPSVVPSTTPFTRPDLTSQMEVAVAEMTWPPEPGQYDDRGMVKQAGELTSMFLAQTYEEVRAFVQGMTQSRPPSREAKIQIFSAAQSLISTLANLRLTGQQYKQAWARLFNTEPNAASGIDSHTDPSRPPQVLGPLGPNVQSVVPLSSLSNGGPYATPNTDAAMRLRVIVSPAGNVPPQNNLANIRFGTEYRTRAADGSLIPFQPVVLVSSRPGMLYVDNVTSTGFTLFTQNAIGVNETVDAFIAVVAGMPTV